MRLSTYLQMAAARDFWRIDEGAPFVYDKGACERLGDVLVRPTFKTADAIIRQIQKPFMITALTIAALALATFVFYPAHVLTAIHLVLPQGSLITPARLRCGVYLATQLSILGYGLRAFGRYSTQPLMTAVKEGRVYAVNVGAILQH